MSGVARGSPEELSAALADRYRIERELGRGGMAVVYLAPDLKHGRQVALKVLRPELTPALGAERFQREIAIAARLQHPHILSLHDSGEAAGMLYYAMPYVEGETLRARLRREVQLDIAEAVRIASEVAGALAHAHGAGVIHRDIKPENILLSGRHAIVADFGIARALDVAGGAQLTETGLSLGTPCYMSPEQGMGSSRTLDGRSDLYALGCLLYEMLAGEPPFTGPTAQTILARHAVDPVPSLRTVRPTVSVALEAVITRALAKVPADRFASAAEFLTALDLALHAPVSTPTLSAGSISPPAPRRRGMVGAIAAAVIAGLIAAGARLPLTRLASTDRTQQIKGLAVTPFANLTGDSTQLYLAAGITDQLVARLAQMGTVRVIGLKGNQASTPGPELARLHQIDALLAGSLQRSGDAVRVTLQLTSTNTGHTIWARSYDGDMREILAFENDVAQSVADRLQGATPQRSQSPLGVPRPSVSPAAYEAFVRGQYFMGKGTETDFHKAIGYFQKGIEIEPTYAAAYAGMAESYVDLGYLAMASPQDAFTKARAAALRALDLDSTLAEAHSSLARVEYMFTWDFAAADREFEVAVERNPKSARIGLSYATFLAAMGRSAESMAEARRFRELDPLSLIAQAAAARPFYNARRYSDAIGQARKALEIDSTFNRAHFWLGMAFEQTGRRHEAVQEFEQTIAQAGRAPVYVAALGHAYAVAGRRGDAERMLGELRERASSTYISPFDVATVYVGLGKVNETFEWLERSYKERGFGLLFMNVDPRFDPVRSDPRFSDLLRRIGPSAEDSHSPKR
jgi:eukaryotic-like serine/threonine-protein kinase